MTLLRIIGVIPKFLINLRVKTRIKQRVRAFYSLYIYIYISLFAGPHNCGIVSC